MTLRRIISVCLSLLLIFSSLAFSALSSTDRLPLQKSDLLPLSLSSSLGGDNMYFLPARDSDALTNPQERLYLYIFDNSQNGALLSRVFPCTDSPAPFVSEFCGLTDISPRAP